MPWAREPALRPCSSRRPRHPAANSILGRLIRPEEVASLITYVATEHASATTGAALSVDGGLVPTIFP
ncbi:SDR family oxidoreductase [Streptomyces flaveolus]